MNRPRVGHIQYLNCLPLYHGLVRHDALLDIELHKGTPTELNRLLIGGQLDVSPISSIEEVSASYRLFGAPPAARKETFPLYRVEEMVPVARRLSCSTKAHEAWVAVSNPYP